MKAQEQAALVQTLKARFEKNAHRHEGIVWSDVQTRLEGDPDALKSLREMEATGGEPDVIGRDAKGRPRTALSGWRQRWASPF